jgi:TRAP-type uncharacterized transport system substrate-binding protein
MLVGAGTAPARAQDPAALMVPVLPDQAEPGGRAESVQLYTHSFALVIGIDKYQFRAWPKLSNAVLDAEAVAEALARQGFTVTSRRDLKSAELEAALKDFFIRVGAQREARLLLWFAGHGATVDGEGYLVPADAPASSTGAAFFLKALSLRQFSVYMRDAKAKHVLAVFDSCFGGTVFDTARAPPPAFIRRATTLPVRQMISSGEADQEVSDNGTFRKLFIAALEGEEPDADANRDGFLTASELGLFLSDKVTNLLVDKAGKPFQTPRYGKLRAYAKDRGDFVFRIGGPPKVAAGRPKVEKPAPAQPPPRGEAAEAWDAARKEDTIAGYEAFIRRYGDTYYGDLARDRLAQLKRAEAARTKAEEGARTKVEAERRRLEAEAARKQAEEARGRDRLAAQQEAASKVVRINEWTVGLAGGLPDGTFIRLASEIARNVNDPAEIRVQPTVTQGATDNVRDLLYLKGVDIGITNADVLHHFKTVERIPNIEKRINFISELMVSEVHLVVRPEINSVGDLHGKRVSLGAKGAGQSTTGPIVFKRLGVNPELVYINNAIALEKMRTGEIHAIVNNGAKPLSLLVDFKNDANFKLLPIPIGAFDEYYIPATLTAQDYPQFIRPGQKVETLGVQTVLAVYNWPRESDRYRRVHRFVERYFDLFEKLHVPPYHPKWRSANLAANVPGWIRYAVAEEKLKRMTAAKR